MMRPTTKVGQQPINWLLFSLPFRRCFKLRYLLTIFILLIFFTYLRLFYHAPSNSLESFSEQKSLVLSNNNNNLANQLKSEQCNFEQLNTILQYAPLSKNSNDDNRIKPTFERLNKLFQILISHEEKYRDIFDYLNIFRFTHLDQTLETYANNSQELKNILCYFQRFITVSNSNQIEINPELIIYLKQVSNYLSDGFKSEHGNWKTNQVQKPVIILAANAHFYDTLQASMKTVDQHLKDYSVAIYDLGFTANQLQIIRDNCVRCMIIPFPFAQIEKVSPHVRNLGFFTWKPIVVQDAVRRFGSIIYGDTSIRYETSTFDRLLIDNSIRGFSCRELPGHYLPCFTLGGTFSWFNESLSSYDDIYIAEAGFVAVTDNFLSRLVLKTWVTCALDTNCIAPQNSKTQCRRTAGSSNTHRYDQSAMVVVLSYYFFQSPRMNDRSNPAPYDMYSSIQAKIADVRRFEGIKNYFTPRQVQNRSETKNN